MSAFCGLEIDNAIVEINGPEVPAMDGSAAPFPFVPFGGLKQSGLGRELGPEGLLAYLEPRSIGVPPALAGSVT